MERRLKKYEEFNEEFSFKGTGEAITNQYKKQVQKLSKEQRKVFFGKLRNEGKEYRQMFEILRRWSKDKDSVTEEEKKIARAQMVDTLRLVASGTIFMIPGGSVLLPLILKYSSKIPDLKIGDKNIKLSIDLRPSSFRDNKEDEPILVEGKIHKKIKREVINGFDVWMGRNSQANDYLTFEVAGDDDIWFHARGVPGSHVVIMTNGKVPDNSTIRAAAEMAASNSRGSGSVEVVYCKRRHVTKEPHHNPGQVAVDYDNSDFITINVD